MADGALSGFFLDHLGVHAAGPELAAVALFGVFAESLDEVPAEGIDEDESHEDDTESEAAEAEEEGMRTLGW
jgi:hypothetical protein